VGKTFVFRTDNDGKNDLLEAVIDFLLATSAILPESFFALTHWVLQIKTAKRS